MAGKNVKTIVPNERWMYNCFVIANEKYFDNSLPVPEFSTKCSDGYWGEYIPQFYFNDKTLRVTKIEGNGTICLNGKVKRSVDSWVGTLLHEMAHEYVFLVMKFYNPDDLHDNRFKRVAEYIRKKSGGRFDIEFEEKIATDSMAKKPDKYDGDGTEDGGYENTTRSVVCVIKKPTGDTYKVWITKTDKNNIRKTVTAARKIKGATFNFYYCYSRGLFKDKMDPDNLYGFGGMTIEEVLNYMATYYKEPLQMFKKMVKITNLNNVNESIKRMHLAE